MNLLFCAYCGSQLQEREVCCSKCGASTETAYYIDRTKNNSSYKVIGDTRIKSNDYRFNNLLDLYGLYTDFRLMNNGDSNVFNIEKRDVFIKLRSNKSKSIIEMNKEFDGQICLLQELNNFEDVYFYKLISSLLNFLPNKSDCGLNISGFSRQMFITISQKVTAWNGGNKSICVGTQKALVSILPDNVNYKYNLMGNKINYIQSWYGVSCLLVPQYFNWDDSFYEQIDDNKIWFISPKEKLFKIVSDNENLENVGAAISCSSISGCISI